MSADRLLDSSEVATRLGCHRSTVLDMIERGELAAINMGKGTERKRMHVPESVVDEWMKKLTKAKKKTAPEQSEMFEHSGVEKLLVKILKQLEKNHEMLESIDSRVLLIDDHAEKLMQR